MYEACPGCKKARAAGNFDSALKCHWCNEKGFRRAPASYVCNNCAGPLCPKVDSPNSEVPHGLVETSVSGGYDSPHLTDCTNYKFSLCEACLRSIFSKFKVPPEISGYMGASLETYGEDERWYQTRLWRASGGMERNLAEGLCNFSEDCKNPAAFRSFVSGQMSNEVFCKTHGKGGAINQDWIPIGKLKGLPEDQSTWREGFNEQAAVAWLQSREVKGMMTHHVYVTSHIQKTLELNKEDEVGCFWAPQGYRVPDWVSEAFPKQIWGFAELGHGSIVWGPTAVMKELARLHPTEVASDSLAKRKRR